MKRLKFGMVQVGRNVPCPCGSGKKYKHCCLENDALSAGIGNALGIETQFYQKSHSGVNYDEPLLVDGESCSECEGVYVPGHQEIVIRKEITSSDNHIRYMADEYLLQFFVMSRTLSSKKLAKPKHASKGFTWYIRRSPVHGGGAIAFFKDVKMGLGAMETLEVWEMHSELEGLDDLNKMRRLLVKSHSWQLLPEL